jgi:hypothetical protein
MKEVARIKVYQTKSGYCNVALVRGVNGCATYKESPSMGYNYAAIVALSNYLKLPDKCEGLAIEHSHNVNLFLAVVALDYKAIEVWDDNDSIVWLIYKD